MWSVSNHHESFVICNDCKCVMSTRDAKPVPVEYEGKYASQPGLVWVGTLTTPAMLCGHCIILHNDPTANVVQFDQFDNLEDDET